MLAETVAAQYTRFTSWADFLTRGRFWLLKVTLIALFAALFMSFPSYSAVISGEYPPGWDAVLEKVDNPFLNMSLLYGKGSHDSKLTFRLTVPVLAHYLHLGINGLIGFQFFIGILSLLISGWAAYEMTLDRTIALFTALLVAGTYAGTTAFVELRGIFDGVAIFLLLLAIGAKNPWIIACAIFLAAWTDERAIIAALLIFCFHAISNRPPLWNKLRSFITPASLAVVAGVAGYLISRVILANHFGLTTETEGIGLHLLIDQFNQFPMGTWTALEGGWLLALLALIVLIKNRTYVYLLIYLSGIVGIVIVSLSVVDITRSMAYMIPAVFIALKILVCVEPPNRLRQYVLAAAIIALLSANYYAGGEKTIWWQYPFPLQILRWAFIKQ